MDNGHIPWTLGREDGKVSGDIHGNVGRWLSFTVLTDGRNKSSLSVFRKRRNKDDVKSFVNPRGKYRRDWTKWMMKSRIISVVLVFTIFLAQQSYFPPFGICITQLKTVKNIHHALVDVCEVFTNSKCSAMSWLNPIELF